jgi:hypothetical protein
MYLGKKLSCDNEQCSVRAGLKEGIHYYMPHGHNVTTKGREATLHIKSKAMPVTGLGGL